MKKAILVLDCGATNLRAIAVDEKGKIMASHALPNRTVNDPLYKGGLIWDIEEIWQKFVTCTQQVMHALKETEIAAVTVTTFGVDGAAMRNDGTLCYPAISWQCSRTVPVMDAIGKYIDPKRLYNITGLQSYHFNTINKLVWLKENRPEVLNGMDQYVFMPSIFLQKLSGEFVSDATMAGTSMLTDLHKRDFSKEIFSNIGLSTSIFPKLVEPGTVVGQVTASASKELGIKAGIPVVAAGHDTQFAVYGSGATINEPVLSSGTWEIMMVRAHSESVSLLTPKEGVTIELDAESGLIDLGVQWVASGVLEWVSKLFYPDLQKNPDLYDIMIEEAEQIEAGSKGVTVIPELFEGGFVNGKGSISGLQHDTGSAHIYRATLEALSYYTRHGLDMIQKAGNFKAESVIVVGGGAKNKLWNQIRADVLEIPIKVSDRKETTVLGAALFAMPAAGFYSTIHEASQNVENNIYIYEPGADSKTYQQLYQNYCQVFK
jgi:L-fuculokinase